MGIVPKLGEVLQLIPCLVEKGVDFVLRKRVREASSCVELETGTYLVAPYHGQQAAQPMPKLLLLAKALSGRGLPHPEAENDGRSGRQASEGREYPECLVELREMRKAAPAEVAKVDRAVHVVEGAAAALGARQEVLVRCSNHGRVRPARDFLGAADERFDRLETVNLVASLDQRAELASAARGCQKNPARARHAGVVEQRDFPREQPKREELSTRGKMSASRVRVERQRGSLRRREERKQKLVSHNLLGLMNGVQIAADPVHNSRPSGRLRHHTLMCSKETRVMT